MNSPVTHQSNRLALYRKHSDGSKRRGYGFPFIRGMSTQNNASENLAIPINEFIVAGNFDSLNDEMIFLGSH